MGRFGSVLVAMVTPFDDDLELDLEAAVTLARWLVDQGADGLEERNGGLWPRWDAEVMARTIREAFGRDYWEQWEAIRCPTLAVRAEVPKAEFEEMAERLSSVQIVELDGAKHDLHLDRPRDWNRAVIQFLESLD